MMGDPRHNEAARNPPAFREAPRPVKAAGRMREERMKGAELVSYVTSTM